MFVSVTTPHGTNQLVNRDLIREVTWLWAADLGNTVATLIFDDTHKLDVSLGELHTTEALEQAIHDLTGITIDGSKSE